MQARPVPFALKHKVEAEFDRLQKEGIVEAVQSAAPIVPVVKSDGSVRICGDYRLTVNQASRVDSYPLPRVDELFATLVARKTFSKLDLQHAYLQLLLETNSKQYTTINTHEACSSTTDYPLVCHPHQGSSREQVTVSSRESLMLLHTWMTSC